MYCTLWEEREQTQWPTEVEGKGLKLKSKYQLDRIHMIFGFLVNMENTIATYSYSIHLLGPLPSKMMRCPWILCFDLLPLQYTDLTHQIWRFLVYIFLCPWGLGALFYLNSNIFIFNMLRFRPHIFLFSLILFKNILKYTYFFSPPVLWYTTKTQTLFVNVKLNTFYLNSLYLGRPWSRPLNSVRKSSE